MPEDQKPSQGPVPAVPDSEPEKPEKPAPRPGQPRLRRFKTWYGYHKKWTVPASVLLLLILLAAIPFTRYNIAGLAVEHDLTVKVLDAGSQTPVSGAMVSLGSQSAQTDSGGRATLHHVKAGHHQVTIDKKYYLGKTIDALSPVIGHVNSPSVELTATGRQVNITVKNLINNTALANVTIKVAGITAKTDQQGSALIVLPAGTDEQRAQLSLDGYNDAAVTIKVSNDKIQQNDLSMTPAGKVYFLSQLSGKIDVVKTNLDGTDRQTVLAGTGEEEDRNTVLLASRDWKYLALLSRRAGSNASLYLISTADDSSTPIESGTADINLVGWSGDKFIYTVSHNDIQLWQSGKQAIKSYDAQAKKAQILDQTTASGSGSFDYLGETIGSVYTYGDQVYYIKNWSSSFGGSAQDQLAVKQATFNSVKPDGSGKKAIRSFGVAAGTSTNYISVDARLKSPDVIALHFYDGAKDNFYIYANGQVKGDPQGGNDTFYSANYPTYLLSPSGNKTFWSEPRDGKNTLFIGDEVGQNGQQIASLSDYSPYGWVTDNYLLVSKNESELYIMGKDGKQPPVKVSDYFKPAATFTGYGGL